MAAPQLSQVLAPQYLRASNGFGGFSSFPQNFASHNTMSFASPRNMAPMTPFNGFTTTTYQIPAMIPSSSSCSVGGYDQPMGLYGGFSSTEPNHPQQWHFDSGAKHHSTNNWNNIDQPQPTPVTKGVLVGNGSKLLVTHTSKAFYQLQLLFFICPLCYIHLPLLIISFQFINLSKIITIC